MNLLLLMAEDAQSKAIAWCSKFSILWTIVGYVVFAIKVIVPIVLIVTGMITLAKAVANGSDDEKKKATKALTNKVIFAVAVFLVIQIVGIIIGLVSSSQTYKQCGKCAFSPFSDGCGLGETTDYENMPATTTPSTNNSTEGEN